MLIEYGFTHHSPIRLHEFLILLKPIIQHRNKTTPDQKHNSRVVQLVAPLRNLMRVIVYRVERSAHSQTRYRPKKETAEDPYILFRGRIVPRFEHAVQDDRGDERGYGAEQVRVDVHGFVVQVAETLVGFDV
jgi:hypothetical protein